MSTPDQTIDHSMPGPKAAPVVNTIAMDAPWRWLAAGWRDLWSRPGLSLGYGLVFVAVSAGVTAGLLYLELFSLILALAAGFMLVGPLLAVGLYEISRRLQSGEPISTSDVAIVSTAAPVQLAFIGVMLSLMLLAWIRIATLLFAIFFGMESFPPFSEFFPALILEPRGLALLVTGTLVGGAIAAVVFSAAVVSVPMLVERDIDAVTAVLTSIKAVQLNLGPMLLWAWLVLILTAFGIATLFVGLIITFPLVGHATWHAYKDVIAAPTE
ncbi:DUF2189 domain-containing protein [Pyruvatibacter sp.]|uniref:DUF2189 domain-containing protein n=1 Tax=Pyruvatibacter sp. TaxID=1981328 RepID=UPI0032EF7827